MVNKLHKRKINLKINSNNFKVDIEISLKYKNLKFKKWNNYYQKLLICLFKIFKNDKNMIFGFFPEFQKIHLSRRLNRIEIDTYKLLKKEFEEKYSEYLKNGDNSLINFDNNENEVFNSLKEKEGSNYDFKSKFDKILFPKI